jgi:MFS family permease
MSHRQSGSAATYDARYQVLTLLCLSAAIAYIQRAAISVPAKEIAADLQMLDLAKQMGWVQSAWYFAYALMQIPSGWFADRFGSRRTLALLSVLWSLATLLSGLAQDFWSLLLLWACMGAAQAGAFPCAAKALGQIFPDSHRARATGLLASGMTVGGALAPLLAAVLLQQVAPLAASLATAPWRLLMAAYALPGLVWSILFLLLVSDHKLPARDVSTTSRAPVDWSRLVRSGPLALLCAQQFFRAAGMVFFMTWFPVFLQNTRGVSLTSSGILTTVAGIGGVVGSMTGGFFSDWLLARTGNSRLSRQGIAVCGMGACSLLILASHWASDVRSSIALVTLGVFCATFGGVSGYTVAISYGGRYVATVFSTMNMCGNLGAAAFPITAGWLVHRTGDWNLLLMLFAGIMAVDAICWALLNPRGTLFGDEND